MKLILLITYSLWAYIIISLLTLRRRKMSERVQSTLQTIGAQHTKRQPEKQRQRPSWLRSAVQRLSRRGMRNRTEEALAKVQMKLAQAGSPWNLSAAEWFGIRIIALAAGIALGFILFALMGIHLLSFATLLLCVFIGWLSPDYVLSRRTRQRQTLIIRAFPSALDMLTVSVEAGLGFDQALTRIVSKLKGPLSDDFKRLLREIQLGSSRSAALQNFAERTGVEMIRLFVSALIQADKLGMGLSDVLKSEAEEVRNKRKMDAQERAAKAPVKMLFPLLIFIFPALFVVILGPAALHLSGQILP